MIGAIDPEKRDVVVVGGGFAGLLAAYILDQQGYEVRLLEADQRLGGLIRTETTPWGIAESGVHSLLGTASVRKLCQELDVELLPINADSKSRFILRNGKMRRFPLSPAETMSMVMRASLASKGNETTREGITVEEWAEKFLGSTALQYLITPMVQGIYGASPAEITIDAAFPFLKTSPGKSLLKSQMSRLSMKSLKKANQRPGGGADGIRMMAPTHGMGALIHALECRLKEKLKNRLITNCQVDTLPDAGNVVLAVPAYIAGDLLRKEDAALGEALHNVEYTPLVTATVFIKTESLAATPKGVGVLMSDETSQCLGILFNSSSFENRVSRNQWVSCTVILGGSQNPGAIHLTDQEIRDLIKKEFQDLFGLKGDLVACIIRRKINAVPKYNQNISTAWKTARQGWCSKPGHILFGNYTGKVSLRGMIDLSHLKLRKRHS